MRLIPTEMLKPDMVLARSVYQRDALVLKAGSRNISRYIPNLTNMGIRYVYVEDEQSRGITIPDAITEQTRVTCKKVLRNTIEKCLEKDSMNLSSLSDSVDEIIGEVIRNKDVQVSLNDTGATDEYTYLHSVSVCVYSLLIGRSLNYNKSAMQKLAMGALLHDIGKVALDAKILYKTEDLTSDEYDYVQQHVIAGYQILQYSAALPEISKKIAITHHERLDGSGYPYGLKSKQIHEFSKIVAIADVYDALTTDRCYREKLPTNKAVDYLIEKSGTYFAPELVQLFIRQIAIYPNGSMVLLSNRMQAIVKDQNRNVPLRPVVRVISDENGKSVVPYEIDLMEELSITIIESELEIRRKLLNQEITRKPVVI